MWWLWNADIMNNPLYNGTFDFGFSVGFIAVVCLITYVVKVVIKRKIRSPH